MRKGQFSFALLGVLTAAISASAATVSYVGYTGGASAGSPFVGNTPVTLSAADARSAFFGTLGSVYYESFQDFSGSDGATANNYNMTFQAFPSAVGAVPTGTITSNTPGNARFRQGPSNARGDFGALSSPLGGNSVTSANNWWVDVASPGFTEPNPNVLTLTFSPGQKAVGFLLSDVIHPSEARVTVNFLDGSTTILTDLLNGRDAQGNSAPLANQNVWFLGAVGTSNITRVTIETLRAGDPIGLDNIYISNDLATTPPGPTPSVPTPAAVTGGAALLALSAARRARRA